MNPTVIHLFVSLLALSGAWHIGCTIGRRACRPRRAKPVPRPWGALPARPQQEPTEAFTHSPAEREAQRAST